MPPSGEAYFQTEYALQALHLAKVLDKLERRHRGHQRHKPSQVRGLVNRLCQYLKKSFLGRGPMVLWCIET